MSNLRLLFDGVLLVGYLAMALAVKVRKEIVKLQGTPAESGKTAKAPVSVRTSSFVILRENGVTVYDSKAGAEASMAWADVERNPQRRAFDAKGVEFVFKRTSADGRSAPIHALWNRTDPTAVELEATSVIPQPAAFREALIRWLDGKGVQVEHDIDLEALILLASRTKLGRPAVTGTAAAGGGSVLRVATASDLRREVERTDPPPAAPHPDAPRGTAAIADRDADAACDESIVIRSVVIIRDNGVTVYESKEKAEASMEWSDVVRNPSRKAFAVRGIELRFAYRRASSADQPEERYALSLWRKHRWADGGRRDVALVPVSSIPRPEKLRDTLVQWLAGKGITVDGGMSLDGLLARASATRHRASVERA